MLDVLIPNYYDELTPVLGIYEENEFKSAMEYWLVSEWLYRQLLTHHQPVVKFKNLYIWGRIGTGYSQAIELQNYCHRLIIIPKTKIECKYLQLPNLIIGLPCSRFKNQWSRYYCDNTNLTIHLLGGSPKQWRNEINNYGSRIYSMDSNYLCKIASYGKIYLNFISRSPT